MANAVSGPLSHTGNLKNRLGLALWRCKNQLDAYFYTLFLVAAPLWSLLTALMILTTAAISMCVQASCSPANSPFAPWIKPKEAARKLYIFFARRDLWMAIISTAGWVPCLSYTVMTMTGDHDQDDWRSRCSFRTMGRRW